LLVLRRWRGAQIFVGALDLLVPAAALHVEIVCRHGRARRLARKQDALCRERIQLRRRDLQVLRVEWFAGLPDQHSCNDRCERQSNDRELHQNAQIGWSARRLVCPQYLHSRGKPEHGRSKTRSHTLVAMARGSACRKARVRFGRCLRDGYTRWTVCEGSCHFGSRRRARLRTSGNAACRSDPLLLSWAKSYGIRNASRSSARLGAISRISGETTLFATNGSFFTRSSRAD